jgi:KUP system potassium uptake protein
MGVVFGDIGTSPLYALKESLHPGHGLAPTAPVVLGILSLIFWSMTMVVTVKYLAFVMRADNRGEGGIFALLALLPGRLRASPRWGGGLLALLVMVGAALLYGDGVITPAISVLSAVEGLSVATHAFERWVVPLTCAVLVLLFAIQRHGTSGIGRVFGPVMLVWFGTIGVLGLAQVVRAPEILAALSPVHGARFLAEHGRHGFAILGSVFLAVTGAEALYADMGHFGARPIRLAWLVLVKPALLLCYFGQGALLLHHPEAIAHPFFALVPRGPYTIALVVLAALATVIASQALISGAFSLTRQAVQMGYLPRVLVKHTSSETEGQIYIPSVNWALAVGCLVMVLAFRESSKLAAAYGIAVTGTMAITSILYYAVLRFTWGWSILRAAPLLLLFLAFDLPFFGANLLKFLHGGYVPILLGAGLTAVMMIWRYGTRSVAAYHARVAAPEVLLPKILQKVAVRVPGVAVFMAHRPAGAAAMLLQYVARIRSLHEKVVLLMVETESVPTCPADRRTELRALGHGVYEMTGRHGFMEEADVPRMLDRVIARGELPARPEELTYFLGRETFIAGERGRMGPLSEALFAFLVRNATPADRHFHIPPERVVELGTQIDL